MSNSQSVSPWQESTRREILQGARELFIHFGFRKTTMGDIAWKAGKSKSALYYYFKTKEDIFNAMALEYRDRQHQLALTAMNEEKTAQEKFRAFIVTVFSQLYEQTNEYSVFKAELREDPLLAMRIAGKGNVYIEGLLKDLLLFGIREGEVRDMTDEQVDTWAKTINTCVKGIRSGLFSGTDKDKFKDHLEFIADLLFVGVTRVPAP